MKQYTAKYFEKTQKIIKAFRPSQIVTLQFFQRADNLMLCGMNEVLEILKKNTDTSKYAIKYLPEGTIINNKDTVLELEGPYQEFGLYEGVIDGIFARQSSLATNARNIVEAANGKEVIFMGDRADHYINQANDGYAVALGGIKTQVTDAQVSTHDGVAVGTVPHALIQMFNGDIVEALKAYKATFPNEKLTGLVDFHNDVLNDTLKALKAFGKDLGAVRIDTSANMSDAMFKDASVKEYGVTVNMVKNVRKALDTNGGKHVKIIVSSGFSVEKIIDFEKQNAPVDYYGVGGSILEIHANFTCDAVRIDGQNIAKAGREYREMKNFKTLA